MIKELLDLVEGSTLLQDAAKARQEALNKDATLGEPETVIHGITDLDPDNPEAEEILPREY